METFCKYALLNCKYIKEFRQAKYDYTPPRDLEADLIAVYHFEPKPHLICASFLAVIPSTNKPDGMPVTGKTSAPHLTKPSNNGRKTSW